MKRLLILLASMSLAACNLDVPIPTIGDPSDPSKETFAASLNIDLSTFQKTTAGTYYKDITVGTGATLNGNQVVIMSYLGLLKDGSLFATGTQQTFVLANLVGGLRDAMPGMKVGGERIIVVPSDLGYGPSTGSPVPPNSTLVFDIKLIEID